MQKNRLEAFSDGVLAIIITIMVLELVPPHDPSLEALGQLYPKLLSYLLSFVFVAIYWNNHHHLIHAAKQISGPVLWANMHLLFWLSLTPFVTAWMGETHFAATPVAVYGVTLIMSGAAYSILTRSLVAIHEKESALVRAVGRDSKGYISLGIYAVAIAVAFLQPLISCALYVVVAIIWLVPDTRIERAIRS